MFSILRICDIIIYHTYLISIRDVIHYRYIIEIYMIYVCIDDICMYNMYIYIYIYISSQPDPPDPAPFPPVASPGGWAPGAQCCEAAQLRSAAQPSTQPGRGGGDASFEAGDQDVDMLYEFI